MAWCPFLPLEPDSLKKIVAIACGEGLEECGGKGCNKGKPIMIPDFCENKIFLVFSGSPSSGGPACRALGPHDLVRWSAKGMWAWEKSDGEARRVATQAVDTLSWELDGLDDPLWGTVYVIAPASGTSAHDIEAGTGWIRPEL